MTKRHHARSTLAVLAVLMAAPGCASTSSVCGPPESLPPGVKFLDKSLIGRLGVTNVQSRWTATGTLEVRAMLESCSKEPMQVEARTQFLDASRMPSEQMTAFKRLYLPQKGTDTYATSSMKSGAAAYEIEIRKGQ